MSKTTPKPPKARKPKGAAPQLSYATLAKALGTGIVRAETPAKWPLLPRRQGRRA